MVPAQLEKNQEQVIDSKRAIILIDCFNGLLFQLVRKTIF